MPKYIDIHSHVNFKAFDEDRDAVIARALENDTWVINVGTQIDTSRYAVEMAHKYPEGVYAIIGLHPIHTGASFHDVKELGEGGKEFTSRGEVLEKNIYLELAKDPKVVAIGECGLDYYRSEEESIAKHKQIEVANEAGKPLMLHIRNNEKAELILGNHGMYNAYTDALEILKKYSKVKGDVHFFAGTWEEAKGFLDFGFTLSFTGVITFTHDYDEVVKNSYILETGDKVSLLAETAEVEIPWKVEPENIPLDIVYEDADLCVINKPAGMIVHPGSGVISGTLALAGVSGKTYAWDNGTTPPASQTLLSLPLNVYGNSGSITSLLGTPDAWALITISGVVLKFPGYLP